MDRSRTRVQQIGSAYGAVRLGVGAVLLVAPSALASVDPAATASQARLLGLRDLLLAGAVLGGDPAEPRRRRALRACAMADAADALLFLRRFRRTGHAPTLLAVASAVGGAAVGLAASSAEGPPHGPEPVVVRPAP